MTYNRSSESQYLFVFSISFDPFSEKDIKTENFRISNLKLKEEYSVNYNPSTSIQEAPYLKTVKEEILEYLHYDKQNVESYIILAGGTETSATYRIIIITEDFAIDEFAISRENNTGAYSTLNEKHVSITGRKLVA